MVNRIERFKSPVAFPIVLGTVSFHEQHNSFMVRACAISCRIQGDRHGFGDTILPGGRGVIVMNHRPGHQQVSGSVWRWTEGKECRGEARARRCGRRNYGGGADFEQLEPA